MKSLQFAEGIDPVGVHGIQVLFGDEHAGAFSGQFVKGAGAKK
jgi:hypothetical protein